MGDTNCLTLKIYLRMKCFKEVAFATVMCGAMVMASCSKREVLPIGEKPDGVTKKEVSTAYSGPAIYVETADGVVHNTGLRANGASSQREWTSPDGSYSVTNLGEHERDNLREEGIPVVISVSKDFGLLRYAYRFEGERPVTDEVQKEKDRVWKSVNQFGKVTERVVLREKKVTSGDVVVPKWTHTVILRPEVVPAPKMKGYAKYIRPVYNIDIVASPYGLYDEMTPEEFEERYQAAYASPQRYHSVTFLPDGGSNLGHGGVSYMRICNMTSYPCMTVEKDLTPSWNWNPTSYMESGYKNAYRIKWKDENRVVQNVNNSSVNQRHSTKRPMEFVFDSSRLGDLVFDKNQTVMNQFLIPQIASFLPEVILSEDTTLKKHLPIFRVRLLVLGGHGAVFGPYNNSELRQCFDWFQLPERII